MSVAGPVITADYSTGNGPLMPGGTVTLRLRATLDAGLAMGTNVTNTGVVTWNNPPQSANASVSIAVGGTPGVGVVNGTVWHDVDFDDVLGLGDVERAVELFGELETLVRGDEPELQHKARYRDDRFRSAFCSPVTAAGELTELFAACRERCPDGAVVLSYSCRGLLTQQQLIDCAGATHEHCLSREIDHAYSTQGMGVLSGVREWILGFRPR